MKMTAWSLSCQWSAFQRYHCEKHLSEFTHKMAAKASWHWNYVTVTVCITLATPATPAECTAAGVWQGTRPCSTQTLSVVVWSCSVTEPPCKTLEKRERGSRVRRRCLSMHNAVAPAPHTDVVRRADDKRTISVRDAAKTQHFTYLP